MSEYQQEKKNQKKAALISAGIHTVIILLLIFLMGWRAPNPPYPEYGIELNFGLDNVGSGNVQPETPANVESPSEQIAESTEQPEPESVPEETPEVSTQDVPVSNAESPVVVEEKKPEVKKTETVQQKPAEPKPSPPIIAEYKNEAAQSPTANQGDNANTVGDKGNPEGSLDANALYGTRGGGGGGFALSMAGWSWDQTPQPPRLPDNENGRVVFEITVDGNGDIIKIETKERSLSPAAEKICREEIMKRSLVKTSSGQAPEQSTGLVTFVLRTR